MPPVNQLVRDAAGGWRQAAGDDSAAIAFIRERFPAAADLLHTPDRRQFMRLMAASLALSGLAGCDDDTSDELVPPVTQAEGAAPGAVLTYASSALVDGFANGVLVKTRDGRPIKIEGNPGHPWSQGGTDVFGQASVLGLYDPFRSQSVQFDTRESDWPAFRAAMVGPLAQWRTSGGQGLAVLVGPTTSPSLAAQLAAWQRAWPQMRLYTHVPATRTTLYEGTRQAFGQPLETHWRLAEARVIVSLDGDLLDAGPHQVGAAREWSDARRTQAASGGLLEMWAAGPVPNLTGAKADHPISAPPTLVSAMAYWLLARAQGTAGPALPQEAQRWCEGAWHALDGARGASVVTAGLHADAGLQAVVARLNAALGNTGRTVLHTAPLLQQRPDLAALATDIDAGRVQALLMLDANPVYNAPADLDFAARLARVKLKIHAGLYADETALNVDWHLPTTHPLEGWGDAYALDGTACLIQPTIKPLYDGRSPQEIVSLFLDAEPRQGLDLLRSHWGIDGTPASAERWKKTLLSGVFEDGRAPLVSVQAAGAQPAPAPPGAGLMLVFRPDPTVWDGAPGDNAWLQELVQADHKVVWENVVGISPGLAAREHLATGDMVRVETDGRTIEGPVWVSRGQADDVVSVTLGYGRDVVGQLSAGLGYNAYALRRSDAPWHGGVVALHRTGGHRTLASTQDHTTMEGHDFVRVQHVGAPPVGDGTYRPPTLYPDHKSDGRAWGMVIDLDSCIGCNACVTACQSENNIAVVGRDEVLNGREMHWLRVDIYEPSQPAQAASHDDATPLSPAHFMPVPCMHCEQAPCEVGCPVEATLHDHEGLNLMVYNRCIGTRACSGYCPYKVRRFNYADYSAGAAPSIVEQRNPDVTVRARGVMEKCTYCVQRIAEARAASDRDYTPIPDGGVRTSCQDACPTRAITFGDLALPDSEVSRAHEDPRRYALLGELNTRPRTTYLAVRAPAAGVT